MFHNLLPSELSEEIEKAFFDFEYTSKSWALAKIELESYEISKNDTLEEIKTTIEAKSEAEKERKARLTKEWKVFIAVMKKSGEKELKLRIQREVLRMKWETLRSILSQKKDDFKNAVL